MSEQPSTCSAAGMSRDGAAAAAVAATWWPLMEAARDEVRQERRAA